MTIKLAYCDYIATLIRDHILQIDSQQLLNSVSRIQFDLGSFGEFCSTMKTLDVEDKNGKQYRITIQEL